MFKPDVNLLSINSMNLSNIVDFRYLEAQETLKYFDISVDGHTRSAELRK